MKYYIVLCIILFSLMGCSLDDESITQQAFKGLQEETEKYSSILKGCNPTFTKYTLISSEGRKDKFFVGYCPWQKNNNHLNWDYYIIVITNASTIKQTTDVDFRNTWNNSSIYYVSLIGAEDKGWGREFFQILYNSTSGKSLQVDHNSFYKYEIDSLADKFFMRKKAE